MTFECAPNFEADGRLALREAVIDPGETNACRLIHGASDHCPGCYVDQLGDFLLVQAEQMTDAARQEQWARLMKSRASRGVYYKAITRHIGRADPSNASPRLLLGETVPDRFIIRENGIHFELSFTEGYSVGLFLDQRDNRRRLLTSHIAAGFELPNVVPGNKGVSVRVLNTFAYTCGFSVCAARAGAQTTSLDLSKKYLEWGKRNFELNRINPSDHDFIFGDAFDWLRRLDKKGRRFEIILLDPPTFSRSKEHGSFQVERDYGKLAALALKLLEPGGVLFASTNAADWPPGKFLSTVTAAARAAGRTIVQTHYVPQPLDFPVSRSEPAYLKTAWLRIN
jgi:23S rRNA (cytosine1962-C5)-methyltransferase